GSRTRWEEVRTANGSSADPSAGFARAVLFLGGGFGGGCRGPLRVVLDARALEREADVLGRLLTRSAVDLVHHLDDGGVDRCRDARLTAFRDDVAVHVVDLARPALRHVLRHRRTPVAPACRGRREHAVERLVRGASAGIGPLLDRGAIELRDLVAKGLAHPRRLRGDVDRDRTSDLARHDVVPAEPRHSLDGIAHRVRAELAPALAPEVVGGEGAVDDLEHLGELLRPLRDFAVVLAGAEDVVALVAALLHATLDLPGRP